MATSTVIWVLDTCSIIEVRRSTQKSNRAQIFQRMTRLVIAGRLVYPPALVSHIFRTTPATIGSQRGPVATAS